MDRESRRHAFNALRCRLLTVRVFRPRPLVWIFESSPDLLVCFALQVAAYEEGPDLSPHDKSLSLMVRSELPKERV